MPRNTHTHTELKQPLSVVVAPAVRAALIAAARSQGVSMAAVTREVLNAGLAALGAEMA
jgi:hypothetical protein